MKLVDSLVALEANIAKLESYRTVAGAPRSEYLSLIEKGTCFVPYVTQRALCFAPSRFAGYEENSLEEHPLNTVMDGRETNRAISQLQGHRPVPDEVMEAYYKVFCQSLGISPRLTGNFGAPRKYWIPQAILDFVETMEIGSIEAEGVVSVTEKEQLVKARVGQGVFREQLLKYWKSCALTTCPTVSVLKASHIKPWRVSNNAERLDRYNGLLLSPNADALFDEGLISFDAEGAMLLSTQIDKSTVKLLLGKTSFKVALAAKHEPYLQYHRANVFKK